MRHSSASRLDGCCSFGSSPELVENFQSQFLHGHFLEHKIDEVITVGRMDEGFAADTRTGQQFQGRSVIIAAGMKRRGLGIPGEERLLRKGVSHSAVQDASLLSGSKVVVGGGGNSGVQTVKELLDVGCMVSLVGKGYLAADESDVTSLRKNGRTQILQRHDLTEIHGRDKVEGVTVQSMEDLGTQRLDCEPVFIQVGFVPNTEFCQDLLELNDKGEIIIAPDCSTSIGGIFACGDATTAFGKRIIIASGEGAKAALSAKHYLTIKKKAIKR